MSNVVLLHMDKKQCKYANRLKEYRLQAGLTQKQVAHILGMQCEDRLSHWEKGVALPSIPNFSKLCKLYGVKMDIVYDENIQ